MSTDYPLRPHGVGASPAPSLSDDTSVEFLHQLDHDLRTPLSTMTTAIDLLRDEWAREGRPSESIAVLERQIARLHALAETLREFSGSLARQSGGAPGH